MNYSLKFHKRINKFLEKCDKNIAKSFVIASKIIQSNPYKNNLDIKKLQWEWDWKYRLRIGKYRFKYVIHWKWNFNIFLWCK